MVIPGCETSDRSGTEVHFSNILRTFWDLSLVCQVVLVHAVGGGFWASHARRVRLSLPQMVSTAHPILCDQYLRCLLVLFP